MSNWDATFFQALGWATLNSIWQMAVLWALFLFAQNFFSLSSSAKYRLGVASVFIGFGYFIFTFLHYFFDQGVSSFGETFRLYGTPHLLSNILNAASLAYLILLTIPVCRMIANWKFIQKIKSEGLQKAHLPYRMFIQKLSLQLGITKQVTIHISSLVASPVTVGFLKPIILLPFAAVNNLTPRQIEAVLLHELAHIRRHDYLVNLLLTAIHVILYFNPFVKAFLRQIEIERESCCDELVVQFEYDPLAYATALLKLETFSTQRQLVMAAAHHNNLLYRIEKIVGLSRKRKFATAHFAGAFIGILMLLAVNTFLVSGKKVPPSDLAMDTFTQPSHLFMYPAENKKDVRQPRDQATTSATQKPATRKVAKELFSKELFHPVLLPAPDGFIQAFYNDSETALQLEEKKQIANTVSNTKKVLAAQWSEVEKAMADAMTPEEKAAAKKEYLNKVEQIDWQKIEKELEATYKQRDWNQINLKSSEALMKAQLDSVETSCTMVLNELHKMELITPDSLLAMPDVSVQEIIKAKTKLKLQIESVRKAKKTIHL